MMDLTVFVAFLPAALALNLTPGADMMFCLGQGLRTGSRAAVAASAGISLGVLVHVGLAGAGLGAAVAALPWLFDVIRWVGVGYLLWLAWAVFWSVPEDRTPVDRDAGKAFRDGLLVNLSNPKVILFVLAFIPQFVDPARGLILPQFMALGLILAAGGLLINAAVGVFAGGAGRQLASSPSAARVLNRISGGIFVALALRLAIMERS